MRTRTILILGSIAWLPWPLLTACGAESEGETVGRTEQALVGDALSGIDAAHFAEAKAAFSAQEGAADGLGPIFNDIGCGTCHTLGAVGGAGEQIERRFGRVDNGVFNPLANRGGSLRQLFSLMTWKAGCNVPVESNPTEATIRNVGRLTTPLFGLGLVDAMPNSFFTALAASQPAATRGTVHWVSILVPNPMDSTQSIGASRVGRFGWKANVPSLVQFSADAYMNEMGITTQSCFRGTSITAFATEQYPNNVPVSLECEDGIPGVDDPVGSCAGGLTEIQEDVQLFADFMTFLAPTPRGAITPAVTAGQAVFDAIGCANCHTRQVFRTPNPTPNGVPGNYAFQPYSDFLLHDMGTLGDRIGDAGDTVAQTRQMRTAPLWGLHFRNKKLHDGRTTDIPTAILAHDGQAAAAKNAYAARNGVDRHNLGQFLLSL